MKKIFSKLEERHFQLVAQHIERLVEDLSDDLDRQPTFLEVLAAIAEGIRTSSLELFQTMACKDICGFFGELQDGSLFDTQNDLGVFEYGDNIFVTVSDFLGEITARIELDTGLKPTAEDFCSLLIEGGVRTEQRSYWNLIAILKIKKASSTKKTSKILRIGDIVKIPYLAGKNCFAIVVAKNRFGIGYGFFSSDKLPLSGAKAKLPVIYSAGNHVKQRLWEIAGHDEDLLTFFPKEPEIYHAKNTPFNQDNSLIGPFGAAETPSGVLRNISQEEAKSVGLLDGRYQQVYLEAEVEKMLPNFLS